MTHPNVMRVVEAGRARGLEIETFHFPDGTKTAADAAAAIGVDVGQIVKSLIFAVDGDVVLAYVSGRNQLDEAKLAAAAGGARCSRVDADVVRSVTGFPIGGVPPFGHDTPLPIFIDPDLLDYDVVWAAAGTWNDVFSIAPPQLVGASAGTVVDLKRYDGANRHCVLRWNTNVRWSRLASHDGVALGRVQLERILLDLRPLIDGTDVLDTNRSHAVDIAITIAEALVRGSGGE